MIFRFLMIYLSLAMYGYSSYQPEEHFVPVGDAIPKTIEKSVFGCAKAPGLNDRRLMNIRNYENLLSQSFNLHERLKQLRIPTLVIHGDTDPIPPLTAESTHKSIPNSQYVLMRQCGHFPYVENPTVYFEQIDQFLEQPEYLYKVVSVGAWEESVKTSEVVLSSADKDFIHLAKEDQLSHVTEKFWKGKDYIVLKLATQKLMGRLVYETNPGGETKYYHLYEGSIPLSAVVEVTKVCH